MAKLLSQGAYGCVYYPGFTCKGNVEKDKKFVTKIEIHDKTSMNEILISNIVKKIKHYEKYFSPIVKHCVSKLNKIKKFDNTLKDCETVNVEQQLYNDFLLIYIKYIKSKDIEKYLISIENPSLAIAKILHSYKYVLNSIKKLEEKKIIHYDLHGMNILYDFKRNIPIIIDFGLSIIRDKLYIEDKGINFLQLKKSTMHYSPKHYTYPPELHLITYVLTGLDKDNQDKFLKKEIDTIAMKQFLDDMIGSNKVFIKYEYYKNIVTKKNENYIDKYRKEMEDYYNKFIGKTRKEIVEELIVHLKFLDLYTARIDYSIVLIKILDKYIIQKERQNPLIESILFFILEIMMQNLCVDPRKRMLVDELNIFYDIVFKKQYSSKKILEEIEKNETVYNKFKDMENYYVRPDYKIMDNKKVKELFKSIEKIL